MRACVVGCGRQAGWLSKQILKHVEGIDWIDKNLSKAESKYYSTSLTEQQNSSYGTEIKTHNIDFAVITSPNGTHKAVSEKFIDAKVPIFVEKPLAISWNDLLWFEEQEQRGAWITTGFQCRFLNSIKSIKDELKINPPLIVDCWKHRGRSESYYDDGWHGTWKYDGGVMTQQGIHAVDLVCFITDKIPDTVSMIGGNFKHKKHMEAEDTCIITLQFNDFLAIIHMTTAMYYTGGKTGDSGLFVTTKKGGFCSAQGGSFDQITGWKNMKTSPNNFFKSSIIDETCYAIEKHEPPPVPVSEAVKSMKIAHAAYASWFDGGKPKKYGTSFDLLGT